MALISIYDDEAKLREDLKETQCILAEHKELKELYKKFQDTLS